MLQPIKTIIAIVLSCILIALAIYYNAVYTNKYLDAMDAVVAMSRK